MDVFVVGAGRVGRTLLRLLPRAGHRIVGASNRTPQGAARTRRLTGVAAQVATCPTLPPQVDAVWLCVPDRAIGQAAAALHAAGHLSPGTVLLHTSGSVPAEVLRTACPRARGVAGAHPLTSLVHPDESVGHALRATWFVEGDAAGVATAEALLGPLGVRVRRIEAAQRAAYHAAAVLASNALVALVDAACGVLEATGIDPEAPLRTLLPLVEATVTNLAARGLPDALTGPIARGDTPVVRAHLAALQAAAPRAVPLYRALAQHTLAVARRLGQAPPEQLDAIAEAIADGR